MGKKRSRIDIIVDILQSIQEKEKGIKPTHIMYRANLAHQQMKLYLEELVEKNFITKIERGNTEYWHISTTGNQFLQKVREMKEFEKTFGL
ncbi:hypothetical protein HZB01_02425 [Candidatus Woesearchaeota archaeon]|nr:hypothetical protein [Candidatus Woesearchaeota archaeon]